MGKMIELGLGENKFPAYVAEPESSPKGGLIVIHEVWGLADHIKSVANKFSDEGYYVLAPNLLSQIDISEKTMGELQKELFDPEKRAQAQPKIRGLMAPIQAPDFAVKTNEKLKLCFDYLFEQEILNQKVAVMGFCFGGSYSFSLAVNEPKLVAAIPFYGHADFSVDELKQIKCPVLAFYGEKDERLIEGLPKLVEAMKAAGVDFTYQVYADCGHAFFNDTNPYTYNEAATKDATTRTLSLLSKTMA